MPIGVIDWLWVLLKFGLALVPPSLLLLLWREMTAHSVSLYAQRIAAPDDKVENEYWVAVQNNEDVALGKHSLSIRILDDGHFVRPLEVYAGCNSFSPTSEGTRLHRLTWNIFPAYDTWSIKCRTTSSARNIVVEIVQH